jgi:hypothetical protein
VPDAPTLSSPSAGDTEVDLSWSANDTGGAAITGYLVEYGTVLSGLFDNDIITGNTDTTRTITGLVNDTGYQFRVSAVNVAGTSNPSTSGTATPRLQPPTTPSLRTSIGISTTSIEWRFTDTASNEVGFLLLDSVGGTSSTSTALTAYTLVTAPTTLTVTEVIEDAVTV